MILFIDTHASIITIALKKEDKIFMKQKESEYAHSVFTMNMIKDVFNEANSSAKDLNRIIVVNGPGSFTGIRIGLSIAKTMAYTLKCKINTISSLDAYLISNDINGEKMAYIPENKGYYIKVIDDNKIVCEESFVRELPKYLKVENKLDIRKIIDFIGDKESENFHHIKANYIKKIEVEL